MMSVRILYLLVLMLSTLPQVAAEFYVPAIPKMLEHSATHPVLTQLTVPLYFLGYSISNLAFGLASDYWGRKKTILLGLQLQILGLICSGLSTHVGILGLGRLLQGLGMGSCKVIARSIVRDRYVGAQMAEFTAWMGVLAGIVIAIAPMMGGYAVHHWGWKFNFVVFAGYTLLIALLIYFLLEETAPRRRFKTWGEMHILEEITRILKIPGFLKYASIYGLFFAGMILYSSKASFFFQHQLHWSALKYGLVLGSMYLFLSLGAWANARLIPKQGMEKLLKCGIWISVISAILLGFTASNEFFSKTLILCSYGYALGCGLIYANAVARSMEHCGSQAGLASALFGVIQALLTAVLTAALAHYHF